MYTTGKASIIMRGVAEIVERKNGRFQIVITEIPYQVNKAKLITDIAELVKRNVSRASLICVTSPTAKV